MRKFFAMLIVTAALAAVCTLESPARGLFRRHCSPACPPCPCPCPASACSVAPPLAPAATITIKGKTYQLLDTGERGDFEHDRVPPPAPGQAPCPNDGETFCGTARRAAKLSIAPHPTVENFANLGGLLDSLPTDQTMKNLSIPHLPWPSSPLVA